MNPTMWQPYAESKQSGGVDTGTPDGDELERLVTLAESLRAPTLSR
jgi:hypothetical protein